jgi:hypothetical protein
MGARFTSFFLFGKEQFFRGNERYGPRAHSAEGSFREYAFRFCARL